MNIYFAPTDASAIRFIQTLGRFGYLTRESLDCYYIEGGGNRPVICWSSDTQEMGRATCSIKTGACKYVLPEWNQDITDKVTVVINRDKLSNIDYVGAWGTMSYQSKYWIAPKPVRARAGSILFENYVNTGRVLEQALVIAGSNSVIEKVAGINTTTINYGTTDAVNTFELLQLMKSGLTLELPVVYDTYSYAHDIQDFYDRVWSPSLALLGLVPPLSQLKIDPKSKFTAKLDPAAVADFFHMAGLNNIADMAVTLSKNRNFAQWYREGALLLAAKVNQLLHLNISVEVVPTEVLIDNSFIGDMPFDQLSVILKESAGHEVVLGNLPDGTQVKTDNLQALPYESIAQLHKQGGWLGGAAIYKAIYSLGMYGPIVVMVKDSQAGLVQRLVNPFLRRDFHTYLLPVGLTRMSAFGQDPDASIDMWVFLELLARWGETASHKLAQIWDALEVPLIRDHVGIKTLIEVTVNGVNISRVTDY